MDKYKTKQKAPFWNNIKVVPYLYILPNMILFIAFMIVPLLMSFYYSLTKWKGLGKPKFIGLDNYIYLIQDDNFRISFFNTIKFTLITVPFLVVLSLLLAILLNQKMRFRGFFRSALYLPSIVSLIAAGMIFIWLFNPQIGLINYIMESLGKKPIDWTNDPKYAMIMIVIGTLWSRVGYNMIIYLAGLQGIPPENYEAAVIDGANAFQRFVYITVPLLKSSNVFIMITCIIYSFKTFDLIYVMTKGGPLNSTETLVVYIYNEAFQNNNYGRGSAAGIILFVILLIFTLIRSKLNGEED